MPVQVHHFVCSLMRMLGTGLLLLMPLILLKRGSVSEAFRQAVQPFLLGFQTFGIHALLLVGLLDAMVVVGLEGHWGWVSSQPSATSVC